MVLKKRTATIRCSLVAQLALVFFLALATNSFAADLTINASNDTGNTTDTTALSRTTASDDILITTAANNTAVTHSTGDIVLSGGSNTMIVEHADAGNNSAITAKVNGTLTISAGTLTVRHVETSAANATAVLLEVTGATSVSGATTVDTSGTDQDAANSATLTLGGDATLTGAVSVTAQGSGNAGSDAIINFNGATNATGGVTLNSATGQAILNFSHTAANATFSGVIDGAADNEGDLNVTNATRTITFANNIGATQDLSLIAIGSAASAGNAAFTGSVDASTITLNAVEGDTSADFNGALTVGANDLTLDGGNASGEDATVTIAGNVLAENATSDILLDDNSGSASVTFDGSSAQSIATRIDGVGGAEGTVNVNNASGVTFEGEIGANQDIAAIVVGAADGANSIMNITDDSGATAWTLGNGGSTADTQVLNIDSDDGTLTVAGTIDGAATDTATINVTDTGAGAAGNAVTFSGIIGGTTAVETIAVGSSTLSGAAVFSANVSATNLTLTTGDAAGETATASFASGQTATITNITLTGGSANANQDATLTVTDAIVAATAISLDDDSGQAAIDVNTSADRAFGGTIDGAGTGEGALTVDDSDNAGAPNTVTFSGNVGGTNSLLSVSVGTDNATAGAAVFSGTLDAVTVAVGSGNDNAENSELTATGAITATTINVIATTANNSATATLDANGDVSATNINITGGTANAGADASLEAAGNVTATTEIQLDDNTGATAGALLVLNGSAAQTVTGTINGQGDGDGRIQNSNTAATVTFTGSIGATNDIEDIIIDANADTTFKSTVAVTEDFTVAAGTATTTIHGTVTIGDELTIGGTGNTVAIASTLGAGDTVFTTTNGGTVITDNDGNADVTLTMPSSFTSGTLTLVNDAADDLTNFADEFAVTDNQLTDYTVQINGGDNTILEVTASAKSAAAAAAELGVSEDAAVATQNAATAFQGDATLRDLLTSTLVAGGTAAKEAAETLQGSPAAMSAAGSAAVTATGTQVIAVGSSRMASLRTGTAFASAQQAGFAAGQDVLSKSVWFKPFVSFGDQNLRKGVAGYETDTYGGALGADVKIGNSTIGASFSYANTDVDSKGTENAQTDVDSYQGTIYADYTTETYYVEALVGFARNEINSSRTITLNNLTAQADYGSNQYMVNIGAGMPMEVEKNHFITPTASFQYTLVDNETYTETGAGAANLRIDQDEVHQALGVVGLKYHTNSTTAEGTLTPEIHAAATYDFAGDDAVSSSNFQGGGAVFEVAGADVVEFGGRIGAGLSFMPAAAQGLTVSANYDMWTKEDFVSHSANVQLRLDF